MVLEKKKKTFNVFVKIIGTSHMFFFFFFGRLGMDGCRRNHVFSENFIAVL